MVRVPARGRYGLMTILGNTTPGSSATYLNANEVVVCRFQAGSSFTLGRLFFHPSYGSFVAGEFIRLGIYEGTSTDPTNLIGETDPIEGEDSSDWCEAVLQSPVAITSGNYYWLAYLSDSTFYILWDTNASYLAGTVADTYSDGFASTWAGGTPALTRIYSIYGTESAPPATGTLGYESAGASSQSVSANQHLVCQFTAGYTGIIRKLKGYISNFAGGEYLRFTLYSNIANTPGTLVSFTDQIEGTGVDGWVTAELTYPIIITSGVTYWLGVQASASIDVAYDTGESENSRIATDTWPEPLKTWTGGTNTIRKYSIYASLDSVTTRWIGHKAILEILDNDGPWINSVWLERVSAVENLTITTINSYFDVNFTAGKYVKAVVYSDNGTDTPIDLLGVSAEYEGDGIARVRSFPLLSPVNFVAGETYWIGYIAPQDTYNTIGHNVPLPGNYNYGVDDTYSDGPEDPCNSPGDYATASWTPVIYAAEAVPEGGGSDAQPGIMVDML